MLTLTNLLSEMRRTHDLLGQARDLLGGHIVALGDYLASPDGAQPPKVLTGWHWPVGTLAERMVGPGLPGDWFDAVPFGKVYETSPGVQAIHPAADLNRPAYKDAGANVYSPFHGEVVFAGKANGWQGWMIIIRHELPDKTPVWSQLAHLAEAMFVKPGDLVTRDQLVGHIGEYLPLGPSNDHLHYALRKRDLPPNDWPKMDRERVLRDYWSPVEFMKEHWGND